MSRIPLHLAKDYGHEDVQTCLIQHGAETGSLLPDVTIVFQNGKSVAVTLEPYGDGQRGLTDEEILDLKRFLSSLLPFGR